MSLSGLLDAEIAAREREELNGLYVAMTRAKERLIVSATQPRRRGTGNSWWTRVEPHAAAWAIPQDESRKDRQVEAIRLLQLPQLQFASTESIPEPMPLPDEASVPQRLGRAVHRWLEWATAQAVQPGATALSHFATHAAIEFNVAAEQVMRIGTSILQSPDCARFFGGKALRWAGVSSAIVCWRCSSIPVHPRASSVLRALSVQSRAAALPSPNRVLAVSLTCSSA